MNTITKHRVITLLDRKEMDFLDKLGKDALFTTGHKLSYNEVLRGLIDFACEIGLTGDSVKTVDELKAKLLNIVSQQIKERRKFPRVKKSLNVHFRGLESMDAYATTVAGNVSLGGLCLEVGAGEPVPQINLPLEVVIDDKEHEPLKAIGRVVWVRENEEKQGMLVGVKLTYLKKEEAQRFKEYLEEEFKKSEGTNAQS